MYMKVFPHGQGDGDGPTHYLVRPDYPGRDEHPPEVLRGDPEVTRDLIDSLDTKWKFTAGVLSWHPDDPVTPEQEQRLMEDFESVAFAGLEPDQRNILWVRHVHADHHELHFVIPRVELASGKAFNPCPPGWQKDFDVMRDLHNHREGWARPDDPARARLHTPEHADLHKARLLRWGKTPSEDDRAAAKEAVHTYLKEKIEQGLIRTRADIAEALTEAGLEINRAGKDYITVKDPESGAKLRLKGGIYAEHWQYDERQFSGQPQPLDSGRTHQGQDRAGQAGDRSPDPTTIQHLAAELERVIEKRAQYNRGRYPGPALDFGKKRDHALSDPEPGIRHMLPASPAAELRACLGPYFGWLGADALGNESHLGAAPGGRAVADGYSRPGENRRSVGGQDLEPGTLGQREGPLHHPSSQSNPQNRLDLREPAGHQTGVSHDRTGTHAQRYPDPHGAGDNRHLGGTQQNPGGTATEIGSPGPSHTAPAREQHPDNQRTPGISAALATLERDTQQLGTALVAFERFVERQIEHLREKERNQGQRMGR